MSSRECASYSRCRLQPASAGVSSGLTQDLWRGILRRLLVMPLGLWDNTGDLNIIGAFVMM